MVELPSQPLGDIDPEFEKIALETGELTYGLSGTGTREKLLLNLANDVCREHFGLAFRLHVRAALSHGVHSPTSSAWCVSPARTRAIRLPPTPSSTSMTSRPNSGLMSGTRRQRQASTAHLERLVQACSPMKVLTLRMSGWPASSRLEPLDLGRCQG